MLKRIKHAINLVRHRLRDVGVGAKRSGKWPTVEKHFLEANPSCAACGGKEKLNVHHIIPFSSNPSLELDENNFLTACMSFGHECHLRICHGGNFKKHAVKAREYAAIVLADPSRYDEVVELAKRNAVDNK